MQGRATPPFVLIQRALERQIRALNAAVADAVPPRAWQHAGEAVALINEVTDLDLRPDDLLTALLEGAETGLSGQGVLDALVERGVHRRLVAEGSLVMEGGVGRFTRADEALRRQVRALLGDCERELDRDPRWRGLLDG